MAKFTMRPLKTSDIFKMSKIIKKMNLSLTVENDDITAMQMGVQFVQKIIENLYLAEQELNEFLADLVGITPDKFAELELDDVFEIFELFKQQKGIDRFLKLAGK